MNEELPTRLLFPPAAARGRHAAARGRGDRCPLSWTRFSGTPDLEPRGSEAQFWLLGPPAPSDTPGSYSSLPLGECRNPGQKWH